MHAPALRHMLDGIGLRNRLVRGAINFAVLVMVGVAIGFADGPVVDAETSRTIEIGLIALGGVLVVVVAIVRHRMYAPQRLAAALRQDVTADRAAAAAPGKHGASAAQAEAIEALEPADRRRYFLAAKLTPVYLVSLVVHENLAIFGLVAAFLTGEPTRIAAPALAALVLNMLVAEPSKVASEARAHG